MMLNVSRIIPGDWAMVESGWLAQPLLSRIARFGSGGRIHQFLWRGSRLASKREKGTEAMRNDEKPFPIESSSPSEFRTWANRSYQRVKGCYCVSARASESGVFANERDQPK